MVNTLRVSRLTPMMRPGIRCFAAVLLFALAAVAQAAEPSQPQRWAIIGSPALRDLGAWNLLAAQLTQLNGIQWVEREQLDAALRETTLAQLLGPADSARRIQAGKLTGADVLVLLTEDRSAAGTRVRVVITDCRLGARLSSDLLPYPGLAAAKQEPFARDVVATVTRTRERFPAGVKWVIGVTPFVSKDLDHRHDAMQAGAELLVSNALSAVPGVAVIETEEAQAIRSEQDLAGGKVERVMPVIVRGEFAFQGDLASFDVELNTGRTPKTVRAASLKSGDAAAFLSNMLPKAILEAANAGGLPPSTDQQFAMLVERGDRIAAVGAWELAVRLRNAALLLKPNDVGLRSAVVRETARWLSSLPPARTLQPTSRPAADSPLRAAWDRAAADLEFLVRNRKITPAEALDLSYKLLRSSIALDEFGNVHDQAFLREIFPAVLAMVPPGDPHRLDHATRWQDVLVSGHGLYEWTPLDMLNLKPMAESLDQLATAEPVVSDALTQAVRQITIRFYAEGPGMHAFLQQLAKSKKPALNWVGRYALLWRRWHVDRVQATAVLPDAEALQREITTATNRRPSLLSREVDKMVAYFRTSATAVGPGDGKLVTAPPAQREIIGEPVLPREPIVGQVRFKRIPFVESNPDATTQRARLVSGGPKLDIFVCEWTLILYPLGGKPNVILPDVDGFSDAAWDGQRVWVGDRKRGIRLFSPAGDALGEITAKDGLPGVEHELRLFAIGEGRVIAVGSFGPEKRAWCAEVQWAEQQAKVNVFHQARNATTLTDAGVDVLTDPGLAFQPLWIKESARSDDGKRRTVLVGRCAVPEASARYPLRIEVPAMTVDVVDLGLQGVTLSAIRDGEGKNFAQSQNFLFLPDGTSLLPDEEGVRQFPPPGERFAGDHGVRRVSALDTLITSGLTTDIAKRKVNNPRDASFDFSMNDLFLWKGKVYIPGPTWVVFDPVTRQTVRLLDGKRDTSYYFHAGASEARGPLMWDESNRLWQVTFEDLPATRPATAPAK